MTKAAPGLSAISSSFTSKPPLPLETANMGLFRLSLTDNTFIAGETFSVADITTIAVVDFGHALEMQIPESAPHVRRWYDQVQERESVQKSKPTHMPDGSPMPVAA